jgi:acyl carrier protein
MAEQYMAVSESLSVAVSGSVKLSEFEARIAKIWADALECAESIGPEDTFFNLGGDSLSMMIVLFQIEEQLKLEVPQVTLLEYPSLKEFCARIARPTS